MKTHCCFCGQQCGIQLKVQGQRRSSASSRGRSSRSTRACSARRASSATCRAPTRTGCSRAAARSVRARRLPRRCRTSEAIARVAAEIARIQRTHGADAFGVLGGASLTTEKTYLMGKFARVCLRTPNIDYNGRLCMVSAGAANKKAFGIDRTTNPWSDMLGTDVVWVGRLERRRVLADHDELHLAGARAGREDHRAGSADHARSPGPATSSCPSSRAATRRCSPACCR